MKKKNIFDTEIQMVDLDNMEISLDETGEPNPVLANDVEIIMKETQVISQEEIEQAVRETQEEAAASDETIVVPKRVIERAIDENPVNVNYETSGDEYYSNDSEGAYEYESGSAQYEGRTESYVYADSANEEYADSEVPEYAEEANASTMLEPDESYDFEDDDKPLKKRVKRSEAHQQREYYEEEIAEDEPAEDELSEEEARRARREAKAEAKAEARERALKEKALKEKEAMLEREEALAEREEALRIRQEEREAAREAKRAEAEAQKEEAKAAKKAEAEAQREEARAAKKAQAEAEREEARAAKKAQAEADREEAREARRSRAEAQKEEARAHVAASKHHKGDAGHSKHSKEAAFAPAEETVDMQDIVPDLNLTGDIAIDSLNEDADGFDYDNAETHNNARKVQNVSREKVSRKKSKKKSRSAFGIVEICGVVIAVLLVVLLGILGFKMFEKNSRKSNLEQFASIGVLYSDMDSIGNEGIIAIGEKASIGGTVKDPDDIVNTDEEVKEEDKDKENAAPVSVNFSSIEKDLKIKFQDKKSGKLINGIRFEVSAKGPKGDKFDWVDDDTDGMIYVDKLQPGNYEVKVLSIDPYEFPDTATIVKVQDTVVYQVINVMDEAKDMSQVDLSKEENKGKDVDEGTKLQDTVEYVESTATPISGQDGYVKIEKSKIKDPGTLNTAYLWGGFRRVDEITLSVGETKKVPVPLEAGQTAEFMSDNPDVAQVSADGEVTAINEGIANVICTILDSEQTVVGSYMFSVTVKGNGSGLTIIVIDGPSSVEVGNEIDLYATADVTWSSSDSNIASIDANTGRVRGVSEGSVVITAVAKDGSGSSAEFKLTVKKTAEGPREIVLSSYSETLTVGQSIKINASVSPDGAGNIGIKWSSDNENVAVVDKGTITAVGSGYATILAEADDGSGIAAAISITVKSSDVLTLLVLGKDNKEVSEVTVFVGKSYQLTAKVEGYASDNGVTFNKDSSDAFTVDSYGLIKGEKIGTGTITVRTNEAGKDSKQLEKTIKVTVSSDVTNDTKSKLKYFSEKDNAEVPVYIKTADGKYVEATFADYYKDGMEFYIAGTVEYKYTGWQTLNGNVYYFTKDGEKVTGEQVIGGTKYHFASDGALMKDSSGSRGIDVSTYQGTIDWTAVKNSGISFVIIRCGFRGYTKGGLIIDSKYQSYIQGATAAGLKVGIYLFSQAVNEAEAVEEASLCVNLAQGYKISYPIFIDSEYANGAHSGRADGLDKGTRTAVCKAFCETIKSAGYTPGVYASKSWFYNKLDAGQLNSYKIWLAHYTGQTDYTGKYDLWQHTDKGRVNGINGNVDLNFSYLGY